MYDLHCHMLPAIDDGAENLQVSLQMARMAVDDGITHVACSPHIYPGLYENTQENIQQAAADLSAVLSAENIPLTLGYAADIQAQAGLLSGLETKTFPTIHHSRYFLYEPPHHVPLPHFKAQIIELLASGYVPIVTHPERLSWIDDYYDDFLAVVAAGAWMQLTAGSVAGRFGQDVKYRSEHMLKDGIVHILATDAHNLMNRAPLLSEGVAAAAKILGEEEAARLVLERPQAVWHDHAPDSISSPPCFDVDGYFQKHPKKGLFKKIFGRD